MKKRVKVAVISCAEMAQRHIKSVVECNDTELYAICDIDRELLEEAKNLYHPVKAVTDYREIINDPEVEAVLIVTPDQTHREIATAALEAHKHVLCEKPMALTFEDCRAMAEAVRKAGTKFMVGQICRYAPGFMLAKQLVDRGEIGELFYIESEYAHDYMWYAKPWRLDPLRHGFLGGGCHAVDLVRWIAGDPTQVMAYSNHKMLKDWPTDDCTVAIMKFPNDVIGKVFVSTGCKRNYTMRTVIYGTKGTIITDNTSKEITVFKADINDTLFTGKMCTYTTPIKLAVPLNNHNTTGELEEFIDCIVNDKPVRTTVMEGAKTVITALAAVESTKTGMPVTPDFNI